MLKILELKEDSDSFSLIQCIDHNPKWKIILLNLTVGKTHFDNPINSNNIEHIIFLIKYLFSG